MQAPSRIQRRSHGLRGVSTLGAAKVIPFHLGPAPAAAPVKVAAPTSSSSGVSWWAAMTTGEKAAVVAGGGLSALLLYLAVRKPSRR